jgi:AcrR family transcriptional regulator
MPYRSSDKTRQKKDAKRTAMMQAAVQVFAEKGYHAATIRDIVKQAGVAIGTFYFYFPDKETLFVHLYEETAEFILHTIRQAINSRSIFSKQVVAALQAYANIAVYEPAIVQLLLVGGIGAVPSLNSKRIAFRQQLTAVWQRPITAVIENGQATPQNVQRTAEAFIGAIDEVILNLISCPDPEDEAPAAVQELANLLLRMVGYSGR